MSFLVPRLEPGNEGKERRHLCKERLASRLFGFGRRRPLCRRES